MIRKRRRIRLRRLRSRIRATSARPSWNTAEPWSSAVEVVEALWLGAVAVERDAERFILNGPPARSFEHDSYTERLVHRTPGGLFSASAIGPRGRDRVSPAERCAASGRTAIVRRSAKPDDPEADPPDATPQARSGPAEGGEDDRRPAAEPSQGGRIPLRAARRGGARLPRRVADDLLLRTRRPGSVAPAVPRPGGGLRREPSGAGETAGGPSRAGRRGDRVGAGTPRVPRRRGTSADGAAAAAA